MVVLTARMAALTARWRLWGTLLFLIAMNVLFTWQTRSMRPAIEEMPPPPSDSALRAMAFGDDEFLFRHLGRWLEFVGDGGGRVRPLREYDYDRVVGWMEALDRLDQGRSDYVHALAARYFGEITSAVDTDHSRVRKIVDYLRIVGLSDPVHRWPWLVWTSLKARRTLKDAALVKEIAHDLQSPELRDPSVPAWVRALPVRLYRFAGDEAASKDAQGRLTPADIAELEEDMRKMSEFVRRFSPPTETPPPSAGTQ